MSYRGLFGSVVVLGLALWWACPARAQETYTIEPVKESAQIKAFSSQGWLTMQGLPVKDHYLFKIAYLRGFLDAVQFARVAPAKTSQVLDDLKGLDLKKLADDVDKFYHDHPELQAYSPAVVVLVMLPRLKAGKPPLPEPDAKEETKPAPAAKPAAQAPPEKK